MTKPPFHDPLPSLSPALTLFLSFPSARALLVVVVPCYRPAPGMLPGLPSWSNRSSPVRAGNGDRPGQQIKILRQASAPTQAIEGGNRSTR